MEDPHAPAAGEGPVLYISGGDLACQQVRLAFEAKGAPYRLRHVNLSALEQLEPWFLKISPGGSVPALLHGDKAVAGCEAICRYVDKTFQGAALAPQAASAKVDAFMKLTADVAHDDLVDCFFMKTGHPVAKVVLPKICEANLSKLNALAESAESDVVKAAAKAAAKTAAEKQAKLAEPTPPFDKAYGSFTIFLDALDKELDRPAVEGKPSFIAGSDFTLADVAAASMLARAHWAAEPRDAALARPRVAAYWAAVSSGPAFEKADVWTGLKPTAALVLLGEAAVDSVVAVYDIVAREWNASVGPPLGVAWHTVADPVADAAAATGAAINTHVVRPVADSPQFKAASLAVKVGADRTGSFLNDKVLTPCKAGGNAAGAWLSDAAEKTKAAASEAAHATKEAAERAAHATKEAAERAAEATKHAAEAAKEATMHAADKVKEAASPKAPADGDDDAERKRKEEEAHKEAAEKRAKEEADAKAKKDKEDKEAAEKKKAEEAAA